MEIPGERSIGQKKMERIIWDINDFKKMGNGEQRIGSG